MEGRAAVSNYPGVSLSFLKRRRDQSGSEGAFQLESVLLRIWKEIPGFSRGSEVND